MRQNNKRRNTITRSHHTMSDEESLIETLPAQLSRFQTEVAQFFAWRWRWLFNILVLFYIPCVILVPSKFVLWISLNVVGFIYVSGATEGRGDPLHGRREGAGTRELVKLLLSCPLMYLIGPVWTMVDEKGGYQAPFLLMKYFDASRPFRSFSFLPHEETISPSHMEDFSDIVFFEGFGMEQILARSGVTYYVLFNYFCYVVPFFIGIHITYLDFFPFLQEIVLNSEGVRRFRRGHWTAVISVASLICFILVYHVWLFYLYGKLFVYLIFFIPASLILFIAIKSHTKRGGSIHIHHYQIGAFLMMFTPFQNAISGVCQGLAAGIFVEGISRWGMDPTFNDQH